MRIINLNKYLVKNKEYVISHQIGRSGTSIGANVREATEAISRADFKAKMYISLKEARETEYWLELLFKTEYINETQYNSLREDCVEIIKILVSITKTPSNKIC